MTDKPRQAAAIEYAKKGYFVFPIKPGEKKSRLSRRFAADGKNWGMSNNPDTIRKNWNSFRDDSNIGLVTGEINGLFVVETDTKEGHDEDGEAILRELIAEHDDDWPDTAQVRSPTGSIHYYFQWPNNGLIIKNADGKLGNLKTPGVDVRAEGGMVLVPPSIRSNIDDRCYTEYNKAPFAAAPQWLLDLICERQVDREPNEPQAPLDKLEYFLNLIPNDPDSSWEFEDRKSGEISTRIGWEGWNDIGMAFFRASDKSDAAFEIFDKWCQRNSVKYKDGKYIYYSWHTRWVRSPPKRLGAGTIIGLAENAQPGSHAIWNEEHPEERQAFKEEKRTEDIEKTLEGIAKGQYTIKVYENDIHKAVDLTETSLLANNSPLYIHSRTLMTPVVTEMPTAKKGIKTKVATFAPIDADYLTDHVNRFIEYQKYVVKDKIWKSIDPPQKVIARLMSRVNEVHFPRVQGLITTQTMRPDGSLLTEPGFDKATGLLLVDPPPMQPIPDNPSRGDVLECKELLTNLIDEVICADDEGISQAVLMSEMLTPVLRGAFAVCPMHVNRSPSPGSGKSYMFDIVAHMVIGQPMPVMAAGRNAEETEKRLGAALMAAQPLISIDNIAGEIGGDALCQIIERPLVNIRVLGKSELRTIASRGTSLFCNGNNLVLTGDVVRRAIIASIDTGLERPELRVFKKDPIAMIMADRGKYVRACLLLARAYIAAGMPDRAPRIGSFGEWSDIVRSTIMWLGFGDPIKSMEYGREEDPDLIAHREFCQCCFDVLGGGYQFRYSASDIVEASQEELGYSGKAKGELKNYDQYGPAWPEFETIVQQIGSYHGKPPEAMKLSRWLRVKKNRPIDGLVIRSRTEGHHTVWWIEKIGDSRGNYKGRRDGPGQGRDAGKPMATTAVHLRTE